jgi:hypothetical protein
MRMFRGVPRRGGRGGQTPVFVPEEQPQLVPAPGSERQRYRLVPVRGEDQETVLYDIFEGEEWYGSRRTVEQCAAFLRTPLTLLS